MSDPNDLAGVPTPRTPSRWVRYTQTLAHLRAGQLARLIGKRVVRRLVPESIPTGETNPTLREPWTRRATFLDDPASRGFVPGSSTLRLLNVDRDLGQPIDWTPEGVSLLWKLELSYFHWMPVDLPWKQARAWMADWLDHAPRDPHAPCWLPFGVAQRVLRWTRLLGGAWWSDLRDDPLRPRLLTELHAQARYLARHQEIELLGNHLVKTAVGLYAAGRFFSGPEADAWLHRARVLLTREIAEQILDDGGHYERSPMYHLFVLVDLADALNVTPPGDPFEPVLQKAVARMYAFAVDCTHGDDEIPLFNDSVFDQAPRRMDVLRYVEQVAGLSPRLPRQGFVAFPQTGLFRLGDSRATLWLDAGETGPPFLQAHAHADTTSIELSLGDWRVIQDRGVFSYQDRARRAWDRSTAAHNTLTLFGENTSDCWGSFRVARRAHIQALTFQEDDGAQAVQVSHDGFRHLPGAPRHTRTVTHRDGVFTLRDCVENPARNPLRADAFLYLGPDVVARPDFATDAPPAFVLARSGAPEIRLRIAIAYPDGVDQAQVFLEPAELAPRFFEEIDAQRIRVAFTGRAPTLTLLWTLTVLE